MPTDDRMRGLLTVAEAAKLLGKTPAALRGGYKKWGVPHMYLGGQIRFSEEKLQEWIEQQFEDRKL